MSRGRTSSTLLAIGALVAATVTACGGGSQDQSGPDHQQQPTALTTAARPTAGSAASFQRSRVVKHATKKIRSTSYRVHAGERLVAMLGAGAASRHPSLALSGGCAARWTRHAWRRSHGVDVGIWVGTATTAAAHCALTVTSAAALSSAQLTVLGFNNRNGIGHHATAHGSSAAPHVSIRSSLAGGRVYAIGALVGPGAGLSAKPDQDVLVHHSRTSQAAFWAESSIAPDSSGSRSKVGVSVGAGARWVMAAIDITPGTHCVAKPSACGFPDRNTTGVPASAKLKSSGSLTLNHRGQVISGRLIHGTVDITAPDVTIKNSKIITASPEDSAVKISSSATGALIEDTTITGAGDGRNSVEYAIMNESASTVASRVQLLLCTECYAGPGALVNSYALVNATLAGAHYEDSYWGGGGGSLAFVHDTLLNVHDGVAAVYAAPDKGQINHLTVDDCLLEGGDYTVYAGDGYTNNGSPQSTYVRIVDNRFATNLFRRGAQYGWLSSYSAGAAGNVLSGNVWDANGHSMPRSWTAVGPAE